jgi:hypothetical protein
MRLAGLIRAHMTQGGTPLIYPFSVSLLYPWCAHRFHVAPTFFLFHISLFGLGFVYSLIRAPTVARPNPLLRLLRDYVDGSAGQRPLRKEWD